MLLATRKHKRHLYGQLQSTSRAWPSRFLLCVVNSKNKWEETAVRGRPRPRTSLLDRGGQKSLLAYS